MQRQVQAAFGKIKRIYLEGGNRWITDNYYLISRNYDGLKRSKAILAKHENMAEICDKYCKKYSFALDIEKLCGFFSHYTNLGYGELSSVPVFLAAAAIIEIARAENCGPAIELLRKLGSEDFEEFLECASPAERILEREYTLEFAKMDKATKSAYRKKLEEIAEQNGVSYNEEAERLVALSHEKKLHIGFLLFPEKGIKTSFFISEILIFALLLGICFRICGVWAILAVLPLYKSSQIISDFLFSLFVRTTGRKIDSVSGKTVFRLESEYATDKTLIVITSLLFGGEKDDGLFARLERFYLSNKRDNHIFGILGDFRDGPDEIKPEDDAIIENAKRVISELNKKYGGCFVLLARKRVKNADGLYGGRERKRGAVTDAVRFIGGEKDAIDYFEGDFNAISGVKYILTLDADTNLSLGAVSELLCAAVHPLARPVIKDGRVVSGWALFQPSMAVSLESAAKTGFSRLIGGSGGVDAYQSAAYDKYQSVLGEGVFCGKGLFDADCFRELVIPKIPDGFVLSHDLPEGAILRTRLVSDVTLSDSAPKSVLSYYGRAGRWIRGDVQNLGLLKKLGSPAGKYMIVENLINVLLPITQFTALFVVFLLSAFGVIGTAFSGILLIFILSSTLLPQLLGIISTPSRLFRRPRRRYFSRISHSVRRDLSRLFYEISAIAFSAQTTAAAAIRSAYRMLFSKKKLLEWVTAGEGEQGGSGFPLYASKMLPSAIIGAAIFVFAPFWAFRLLGLLWFCFPIAAYYISKPIDSEDRKLSADCREYLIKQSAAIWSFFSKHVNSETNHLPPDNVQYEPVYARADRTSPTNIGLYLLSCLAAADFGFIDADELERRLRATLSTLKKMEKWNGHLYNWYATDKLDVIGGAYVSTVDSGNFVTSICTLREGLKEYGLTKLSEEFAFLETEADFSVLYNPKKSLFSLGFEVGEGGRLSEICYDLYMSEARTTSYYALAKGIVPKKHWAKLSRTLISGGGYIGMASWTGTTFEYFMPPLFLPVYDNSFEYEALRFAFEQQRKKHIATGLSDGVWGLSESAFFSFDSEMNYQYKAVGVQKLGLKRYLTDEPVVSPYSSFLMLKISPESCVNNLRKLEEYGMIGEHGHYEACDFTPTRAGGAGFAVIKSYMSHHLGMSITAAANACFAEVFVRRFMRNPSMAAAYELLQEKVPDVSIYHDIAPEAKPAPVPPHTRSEGSIFSYSIQNPELRLVNSGRLTMLVGDLGHVSMRFGKVIINDCDFDLFNAKSGFSLKLSGKSFVPTGGKEDESASFTVEHKDGAVSHIRTSGEFSGRARFSTEGKCIRIETLAGEKANCFAELEFPIALDDEQTFKAHPAFSKLSISAEFVEGERIILYSRKPKLKARPLFLAVALADEGVDFSFDTRLTDVRELEKPLMGRTGASVNPYLRIKTGELAGGRACFLISCAATKEEALSAIRSGRAKYKENGKKQGIYRHLQPAALSRVLGAIYFSSPVLSQAERVSGDIHSLWRYSISGDYPILLADTNDDSSVYESLILFRTLTIASVRCELVVVVREADRYARESRRSVMKAVSLAHCEAFLGRRGGVFVIDYEDFRIDESRNDYNYLLANSVDLLSLTEEGKSGGIIPEVVTQIENRENNFGEGIIKVEGGSFDENGGFIIDKSAGIPLEWSYVTANHCFGSVQTQNSLGFSYFRNAQKNKLTEFSNNPYFPNRGERILMFVGGKAYDLCAVSSFVRFGEGKVIWLGRAGGINYEMSLFVCEKFPVKLIKLNHIGGDGIVTAVVLRPDGGRLAEITKLNQGVVCFRNLRKSKVYGFAGVVPSKIESEGFSTEHSANSGVVTDFSSLFGEETLRRDCAAVYTKSSEVWFYVGAAPQQKTAEIISGMIDRSFAEEQEKAAAIFYKSLMPKPKEKLEASFAVMYNHFMPYQVTISRFFSRCAYYQVGGAYGYRDQLQDSLMLMKTRPDLVRTHIIRCSAHQYEDGGVQHWWHPPREGVRTRCSDDFLWLPLVTAEYLRQTGDGSVLDVKTRWLVSPELREGESERYEHAGLSEGKDSVYEHCVRALERSLSFGKHGLPLMGSCDWNDGFSELGEEGRGESVFTAWLFIWAVREFGIQMIERGDERAEGLQKAANSVLGAIESYCFDGDRYLRAFTDNGEALGAIGSGEAELDILPQCMPAIVGGADESRVSIALDMAYSMCFDGKWQIMKLFTPPFDKDTRKIGYIQSYVPGIRENGGQYTHASMWMALGLWRAGKKDKAVEAARALNPVIRCSDKRLAEAYKIEPFVLSGDIYSNPMHPGRGGWSWYTGSAAWFWRLIDEIWE